MKTLLKLSMLLLLTSLSTSFLFAQKVYTVAVNYSFANTAKGYDHLNRVAVYVDYEKVAVSKEQKQSKPGTVTFSVPAGEHNIQIIAEAFYEGKWEERTKANDFSIDCVYDSTMKFNKNKKITLVFDIDEGTIVKKVK